MLLLVGGPPQHGGYTAGYLFPAGWRPLGVAGHCDIGDWGMSAAAPTVTTFLEWVVTIGGFSGRKADGKPGPLVLMRGWLRAQEGINMYRQLTEKKRCV